MYNPDNVSFPPAESSGPGALFRAADQNVFNGKDKEDRVLVKPTKIPESVPVTEATEVKSLNCEYLIKLIELCDENDIDIMLTKCPLNAKPEELRNYAYGFQIAQEHGKLYFDGFSSDFAFDEDTDMWDKRHLNSLGARKYSKYLGSFILSNYPELGKSSTDDAMRAKWDDRYESYLRWLDSELPQRNDLHSYLMLCTHPQYSVKVEIGSDCPVRKDKIAMKLLSAIKNCEIIEADDAGTGKAKSADPAGKDLKTGDPGKEIRITVFNGHGDQTDKASFAYDTKKPKIKLTKRKSE